MARGSLYVTCIVSTCVCLLQRFVPAAAVMNMARGGPRHLHLGGPLERPVLQQGELSTVCVGLSERDLIISMQWHDVTRKIWGGALGGPGIIFWGKWPPWHPLVPPLSRGHKRDVLRAECLGGDESQGGKPQVK